MCSLLDQKQGKSGFRTPPIVADRRSVSTTNSKNFEKDSGARSMPNGDARRQDLLRLRLLQHERDQLRALEERRGGLVAFAGDDLYRDRGAGGFVAFFEHFRVIVVRHG